jgi:hypothetical protein
MNVELSPPPGVDRLEPGDYVDALVELVVVPQSAGDYYGPNENLRADLEQNGETWKPVYRQATGNDVDLVATRGRVTNSYPPVVETDEADVAAFTLSGGLAYLPVTVTGLTSHAGYELVRLADGEETPVEQAVHGNDFWQTGYVPADGTWSRTYNVRLDTPTDEAVERRFILRPSLR